MIRRIFVDYVAGHSPRAIAAALNAEGIPGRPGTPWHDTGIRGRAKRRDGILRNPIYVGPLRWNRSRWPCPPSPSKTLVMMRCWPAVSWTSWNTS